MGWSEVMNAVSRPWPNVAMTAAASGNSICRNWKRRSYRFHIGRCGAPRVSRRLDFSRHRTTRQRAGVTRKKANVLQLKRRRAGSKDDWTEKREGHKERSRVYWEQEGHIKQAISKANIWQQYNRMEANCYVPAISDEALDAQSRADHAGSATDRVEGLSRTRRDASSRRIG